MGNRNISGNPLGQFHHSDLHSRVMGDNGHSAGAGPSGTKDADVGHPHLPKSPPPAAGLGKGEGKWKGYRKREAF